MPSRFAFYSPLEEIVSTFNLSENYDANNLELHPYYNLKPTNRTTAIINESGYKLVRMKWDFIKGQQFYKVRSESIHEKKMFSKAFKERRCVILANGFFEWEKDEKKSIPHYFIVNTQPLFAIAGLFNKHLDTVTGEEKYQCAVATIEANELVAKIFLRMPVILTKEGVSIWLNQDTSEKSLKGLLKPFPPDQMTSWKVKPLPSKGDNGPDTFKPAKESSGLKKKGLESFF